jgi:hypothetical protein
MNEYGIWLDSTQSNAIVTNAIPASKAHVREDVIEYYGGYLVAESVPTEFMSLVKAAPDLLAALQGVLRVADRKTDEFDAARAAIRKAKGETANE